MDIAPVLLGRIQFAVTTMFHILWPVLIIGMGIYLLAVEAVCYKTGNRGYYRQARFWQKLFFLALVMGVISGIPLEFQFGTNWSVFSRVGGDIFGHMLGFEAAMAFMLVTMAVLLPIILTYTAFVYRTFRGKVASEAAEYPTEAAPPGALS